MSRLLFIAAMRFEARMLEAINALGFPDVRLVHLTVPRNLDLAGTRITELAARAVMTKQSMSILVEQCEALGFVERLPDSADRRAKIVAFTPHGFELIEVVRRAIVVAEREMRKEIGDDALEQTRSALLTYAKVPPIQRPQKVTPPSPDLLAPEGGAKPRPHQSRKANAG